MESLRKKRSHIKGLSTRQGNRLHELEALPPDAGNVQSAKSLQKKLEDLDTDFKQLHYDILDQIKESDKAALESAQEAFMVHYDQMEEYAARIAKFISVQPVCNDEDLTTMSLKLRKLQRKIGSTGDTLSAWYGHKLYRSWLTTSSRSRPGYLQEEPARHRGRTIFLEVGRWS